LLKCDHVERLIWNLTILSSAGLFLKAEKHPLTCTRGNTDIHSDPGDFYSVTLLDLIAWNFVCTSTWSLWLLHIANLNSLQIILLLNLDIYVHHTLSGGHIGFTEILSFYGSLPRFQLEDGSDQTARWIDFKFADYVDLTPI
jgi:hypothetical protein